MKGKVKSRSLSLQKVCKVRYYTNSYFNTLLMGDCDMMPEDQPFQYFFDL